MIGSLARSIARQFGYSMQIEYKTFLEQPASKLVLEPGWILSNLAERQNDVTFIQIGANDGKRNDPIHRYVIKNKWRGLLVEPDPTLFTRLQINYSDQEQLQFANIAVGTGKPAEFFFIDPSADNAPSWANGLGSFRKDVILSHKHTWPELPKFLKSQLIETVPPDALFDVFGQERVDLLLMDVEGYEHDIITKIDFRKRDVSFVYYEHKHLSRAKHEDVLKHLSDQGYQIGIGGIDVIAVKRV